MSTPPALDAMNTKFKVLKLSGGNYLIAIAGGEIDGDGLARIFREVSELSPSLLNCKVLIDLEAARLRLQASDMDALFYALQPELGPHKIQIAVVSAPEIDISNRLRLLTDSLSSAGLKVAVFGDTKSALGWLSDKP
jgi:hypothetical protein